MAVPLYSAVRGVEEEQQAAGAERVGAAPAGVARHLSLERRVAAIRVFSDRQLLIDAPITLEVARTIALVAWALPKHLAEHPEHEPHLATKLLQIIAGALTGEARNVWNRSVFTPDLEIDVHVFGLEANSGTNASQVGRGASGGQGAWPAGGGGGGGGGRGEGGAGADGAVLIMQWSFDGLIFDVQALVMPGSGTWYKRQGVDMVSVLMFGGGGGGGTGG
jgi:hypothetical protein